MSELRPGMAPSQALQDALKRPRKRSHGSHGCTLRRCTKDQRASGKRMGHDVIKTNLKESEMRVHSTKPFNALTFGTKHGDIIQCLHNVKYLMVRYTRYTGTTSDMIVRQSNLQGKGHKEARRSLRF